ncbi:MAG: hypothetical protein KDJ25_04325 [Rhodoblastus sp.]|nr:hypothetical protein [Rhodoblastus sp.]
MKNGAYGRLRLFASNNRGSVAVVGALMASVIVGSGALAVQQALVLQTERALQASTEMAALAGAQDLGDSTDAAVATANSYAAKNPVAGQTVTAVSGYPRAVCLTSTNIACGSVGANAIVVKQQIVMPLVLGKYFGVTSKTMVATATASAQGGAGKAVDVMFVIDTTRSMANTDARCSISGASRLACAEAGVRKLLLAANPSLVRAGLAIFPPVKTATDATREYNCSGATPTIAKYSVTSPIYTILGLSNDYKSSPGATTLSTTSNMVRAVGGVSGCTGLQAIGGVGTYFADAISAAQSELAAHGRADAQKVIVFLSDGDAGASSSNVGTSKYANQCHQGIAAAQNAAAAGTWVYSAAYGAANSGGCSTDNPAISPCATMLQIASSPEKFFPDTGATSVSCTSTINTASDVIGIFSAIGTSLSATSPRLILNSTS